MSRTAKGSKAAKKSTIEGIRKRRKRLLERESKQRALKKFKKKIK